MGDVRRLDSSDVPALAAFLKRLPEGERRWFREDVLDPAVAQAWAGDGRAVHLLDATEDGRVRAYGAIVPGRGWSSHVGELTLMVDPEMRRQGLGSVMARRLLLEALGAGLKKVVVEVVADEESAIAMFTSMGFAAEAMLRDHVRDREDRYRDLLVLAHPVEDNWEIMAASGIEDALA